MPVAADPGAGGGLRSEVRDVHAHKLERIIDLIRGRGYNVRSMDLRAQNHIPQRRHRKYLFAVHEKSYSQRQSTLLIPARDRRSLDACLDEAQALVSNIEAARLPPDLAFDVDDFLLYDHHEMLQAALVQVGEKARLRREQDPESLRAAKRTKGKKRKLGEGEESYDVESDVEGDLGQPGGPDADPAAMSPAPWIQTHQLEYEKAELKYLPAHENPMKEAYSDNPWYQHLTPRYQECILYWDEVAPTSQEGAESFLDLYPVARAYLVDMSFVIVLF